MKLKKLVLISTFLISPNAFCAKKGSELYFNTDTSNEFIVRWAFQKLCDHVFDPRTNKFAWPTTTKKGGVTFDPSSVKTGDIIFVRDIEYFFKTMHYRIKKPYIMVTHGEFRDTTQEKHLELLDDDMIIAWFAIHPCMRGHRKYYPIPLGLMQDRKNYDNKREFNEFLKQLREAPKRKMLYMNFDADKNPERMKLKQRLMHEPFCFNRTEAVPFVDYLKEMAEFKFALSPRGWGPDCYRTWEALLVGTIPIVRRNVSDWIVVPRNEIRSFDSQTVCQLDTLYTDLPILVIDNWKEITLEFLEQKYREITAKKYDLGKLYIEYWQDKIFSVRDAYLHEHNATTLALLERQKMQESRNQFSGIKVQPAFEKTSTSNSLPPEMVIDEEVSSYWGKTKQYIASFFISKN